tara:strand:+ start:211 stop:1026 length:816 start_codon:yes stop_codon:yes gene_type:complete
MDRKSSIKKNKYFPRRIDKNTPIIYGTHAVTAALSNPNRQNLKLVATSEALKRLLNGPVEWSSKPRKALEDARIVKQNELSDFLPTDSNHQGLLLYSSTLEQPSLESILHKIDNSSAPLVILDQIKDPRNVGAIMRSASVMGAKAIIIQSRHSPSVTGALAKAASGALETLPLIQVTNLVRAIDKVKDAGYWIVGLDTRASNSIEKAFVNSPIAIILGSEENGLRRLTTERCDILAVIPTTQFNKYGTEINLNVSNAAAVALYQNKILQKI